LIESRKALCGGQVPDGVGWDELGWDEMGWDEKGRPPAMPSDCVVRDDISDELRKDRELR
jgi:hypothetical protein